MKPLRRAFSILLMAVFSMPSLLPWFSSGATDEVSVPACCRRHGLHHCFMSAAERATLQAIGAADPEFNAPAPQCPYQQSAVRNIRQATSFLPVVAAVYASVASHRTGLTQTHSMWRRSRERSRQKRGPPADLLS
jgi:hypothetical protein